MCLSSEIYTQLFVNALHGQPHHIKIAAIDGGYTDISYPFLNAVGTRLIKGFEGADVVIYFGG